MDDLSKCWGSTGEESVNSIFIFTLLFKSLFITSVRCRIIIKIVAYTYIIKFANCALQLYFMIQLSYTYFIGSFLCKILFVCIEHL